VLNVIKHDSSGLDKDKYYEMRFEDLENNPVNELTALYKAFGFKNHTDLQVRVNDFLKENKDFQKNTYFLTAEDDALIRRKLKHHMEYFRYI